MITTCFRFPTSKGRGGGEGEEQQETPTSANHPEKWSPPVPAPGHPSPAGHSAPPGNSTSTATAATSDKTVIKSEDSVQDILRKLSGEDSPAETAKKRANGSPSQKSGTKDPLARFDSPDISRELESAFFCLDAAGETEI